jgi:preprotein translocase subunit SecF
MFFITHRKILFWIIGILSIFSVGVLFFWGLTFGIEFTGGTIIEVAYIGEVPAKGDIETKLNQYDFGQYSLRQSESDGYILRLRDISEEEYNSVQNAFTFEGTELVEKRRASVGPVIGEELKNKAFFAIATVVVLIVVFVAFAFRNMRDEDEEEDGVMREVSSWTYGIISIFVLLHDILIPVAMFSVLGYLFGAEVDVLIVMALLTILGYSVNDTIVIFDRVRENMRRVKENGENEAFEKTVGRSLSETYARSINTSFTTLIMVVSLLVFGGSTTMYFALTLSIGIFAGTYSSLALAAPLLVVAQERKDEKLNKEGIVKA